MVEVPFTGIDGRHKGSWTRLLVVHYQVELIISCGLSSSEIRQLLSAPAWMQEKLEYPGIHHLTVGGEKCCASLGTNPEAYFLCRQNLY